MYFSLGAKSILRSDYSEVCPIWLWEKANVTCVIGSYMYHFLAEVYKSNPNRAMKLASPCFWSASRALILGKTSPYTERFNHVILRVIEAGYMNYASNLYILNFIHRKNISRRTDTTIPRKQVSSAQRIIHSNVAEAFVVIFIGILFSICLFLGECIIFKCKTKKIVLMYYFCVNKQ
jgi:hypothetical protein